MPPYSVAVAAFDFAPVAACAAAMAWLAGAIAARRPALAPVAFAGALLVPFGGLCKASWKLVIALGGAPIGWLENLLFVALAPGFTALAFALHHAVRPSNRPVPRARALAWAAPPLAVAAVLALSLPGRAWLFWLIAVTTVANGALVVQAVRAGRAAGLAWTAPACFAASFAATLALAGLARLPAGEASAWMQESVNLAAQLALAAGAWQLARGWRGPVATMTDEPRTTSP